MLVRCCDKIYFRPNSIWRFNVQHGWIYFSTWYKITSKKVERKAFTNFQNLWQELKHSYQFDTFNGFVSVATSKLKGITFCEMCRFSFLVVVKHVPWLQITKNRQFCDNPFDYHNRTNDLWMESSTFFKILAEKKWNTFFGYITLKMLCICLQAAINIREKAYRFR